MMVALVCGVAAFLLGAIPTGLWVGRWKGIDVRTQGSGNIGATNVWRVVGKIPGLLVLVVDVAKGWLPVAWIAPWVVGQWGGIGLETLKILVAVAAVSGHIWNPFLRWRGGRGVATGLGVLLGLDFRVGLAALGIWIVTVSLTRYVSVASMTAAFFSPFLIAAWKLPTLWVLGGVCVALAIIARHRPNIRRLLRKEEPRIGR
jgi:glycerol-3-phosphate acyltransferase PlsY